VKRRLDSATTWVERGGPSGGTTRSSANQWQPRLLSQSGARHEEPPEAGSGAAEQEGVGKGTHGGVDNGEGGWIGVGGHGRGRTWSHSM
jgi:hypothetical protein